MENKIPYNDLQSTDVILVQNSLDIIKKKINDDKINLKEGKKLFTAICPLLCHNHYRIRLKSFEIITYILETFSNSIPDTISALKYSLSSLCSISKEVILFAERCLDAIFQINPSEAWWPDCDAVLLNSGSIPQKVKLLTLLQKYPDDVSLSTIAILLNDPQIQVSSLALSILDAADQNRVQATLQHAYNAIGMKNPYAQDLDSSSSSTLSPQAAKQKPPSPEKYIKANPQEDDSKSDNATIINSIDTIESSENAKEREIIIEEEEIKPLKKKDETINKSIFEEEDGVENKEEETMNVIENKEEEEANEIIHKPLNHDDEDEEISKINLTPPNSPITQKRSYYKVVQPETHSDTIDENQQNSDLKTTNELSLLDQSQKLNSFDQTISNDEITNNQENPYKISENNQNDIDKIYDLVNSENEISENADSEDSIINKEENVENKNNIPEEIQNDEKKIYPIINNDRKENINESESINENENIEENNNNAEENNNSVEENNNSIEENNNSVEENNNSVEENNNNADENKNSVEENNNSVEENNNNIKKNNENINEKETHIESGNMNENEKNKGNKNDNNELANIQEKKPQQTETEQKDKKHTNKENDDYSEYSDIETSLEFDDSINHVDDELFENYIDKYIKRIEKTGMKRRVTNKSSPSNKFNPSSPISTSIKLVKAITKKTNPPKKSEDAPQLIYDPVHGFILPNKQHTLNDKNPKTNNNNNYMYPKVTTMSSTYGNIFSSSQDSDNDSKVEQFVLRDMSGMNYKERISFIDNLRSVVLSSPLLPYPAEQMMDCALTGVHPLTKQVSPKLCELFMDIISRHPEIISPFADELVSFLIRSQNIYSTLLNKSKYPSNSSSSFSSQSSMALSEIMETFDQLEDALILDSDPYDLIAAAIALPLTIHIESFIIHIYKPDSIILERGLLRNLLNRTISALRLPNHPNVEELLTLVSQKQPDEFMEWGMVQPPHVRKLAIPFAPKLSKYSKQTKDTNNNNRTTKTNNNDNDKNKGNKNIKNNNSNENNETVTKKKDQQVFRNFSDAFLQEIKKGDKADMQLVTCAIEQMTITGFNHEKKVLMKVLDFLGSLKQETITNNKDYIQRICCSHFQNPQLMQILTFKEELRINVVIGLSRFVWFCPQNLLSESFQYYHQIYDHFCNSQGKERDAIILIFYALKKATGKSIVVLKEVSPRHSILFKEMFAAFEKSNSI